MSLHESSQALLERFLALHPRKIDLSLERIEELLRKLGSPHLRLPPVVHVAGTNGKGSVVAFMRAILEAAGKRVHVYTSPHLVRFHERIRLGAEGGGRLVDEVALVKALAECERINAGAPITIFEIATAAAFKLFAEHPADYLLLEVGLGGRYDATNVIDRPAASVITPVSQDHAEFLGTELGGIAREKAGIIKKGRPAVCGWQQAPAFAVIEAEAQRLRAPLIAAGQDFTCYEQNGRFVFEDGAGLLDLPFPKLSGHHQLENAAVAIATIRLILPDLPEAIFEQAMGRVEWPARLQRLSGGALADLAPAGAEIWLDGGHNADGGKVLAEAVSDMEERRPRPVVMIYGALMSKDSAAFLRPFRPLLQEVVAVPLSGEHASRTTSEIADIAKAEGLTVSEAASVEAALRELAARNWQAPPRILIAGSLYLAGEVLKANGDTIA